MKPTHIAVCNSAALSADNSLGCFLQASGGRFDVEDGLFNASANLERCVKDPELQHSLREVLDGWLQPEMNHRPTVQDLAHLLVLKARP